MSVDFGTSTKVVWSWFITYGFLISGRAKLLSYFSFSKFSQLSTSLPSHIFQNYFVKKNFIGVVIELAQNLYTNQLIRFIRKDSMRVGPVSLSCHFSRGQCGVGINSVDCGLGLAL